jgi:uncharacterized MAPEG superfamily protein
MDVALACIPIAFLLIYLAKIPLAVAMHRQGVAEGKGYDNRHPRDQQARVTTAWGKRAVAAHYNGFETFPAFAIGVLVAYVTQSDPGWTQILALVYVVTRILYIGFYLGDIHWARSSSWFVGFACIFGLYLLPLIG